MPTDNCALIDSHCHPHFPPLFEQLPAVLAEMQTQRVTAALAVATDLAEATVVKKLAADYPNVFYAACGIHPTTDEDASADTLIELCGDACVLAVGETGLDFYRQQIPPATQRRRFAAHIAAAREINKPLIIHTRDSLTETIDMLRAENADTVGGVMHCFTGDKAMMRQALDINFYVSFSGIVSFKNAATLRETAKYAPSDRYLVETDAPYLAPTPHRGKTNTPGYVRFVAAAVAAARECDEAQVAAETTDNFIRLFRPPSLGGKRSATPA